LAGLNWSLKKAPAGNAGLRKGGPLLKPVPTRTELPGDPADTQSRYLEAAVSGVLIATLYAPNGNAQPGPKFKYANSRSGMSVYEPGRHTAVRPH
jgi:exodeoxyribonuclease-3